MKIPNIITHSMNMQAADINSLRSMNAAEYNAYFKQFIFYKDHHDILRLAQSDAPIAVNRQQLKQLVEYLEDILEQELESDEATPPTL